MKRRKGERPNGEIKKTRGKKDPRGISIQKGGSASTYGKKRTEKTKKKRIKDWGKPEKKRKKKKRKKTQTTRGTKKGRYSRIGREKRSLQYNRDN